MDVKLLKSAQGTAVRRVRVSSRINQGIKNRISYKFVFQYIVLYIMY